MGHLFVGDGRIYQWPCWPGTDKNWRYRFHIYFWPMYCKAYVRGYTPNSYGRTDGTFTYLHFRILKFPLNLAAISMVVELFAKP